MQNQWTFLEVTELHASVFDVRAQHRIIISQCQCVLHRRVVQRVQKKYPSSELLAAGWSLGGNILVRYLGEEGAKSPISAAASLCNPLDLV